MRGFGGVGEKGGWGRNLAPLSPHTPHTPVTSHPPVSPSSPLLLMTYTRGECATLVLWFRVELAIKLNKTANGV
ncbi:MAG: hypothetical protein V7K47_04215 [Nostoc sp.]